MNAFPFLDCKSISEEKMFLLFSLMELGSSSGIRKERKGSVVVTAVLPLRIHKNCHSYF